MEKELILKLIKSFEEPVRPAVSTRFPLLKKPIISTRRAVKKVTNTMNRNIARRKDDHFFTNVIARHQSVLLRKLGNSDLALQKSKIINLERACRDLNGTIIKPGEIFSFWEIVGNPTYRRGYTDGMLLSDGKIQKGVGGGLCQLSNFLCWILLHAETEVIERTHHSRDVFPDSGRVLPFGSGATCLYNFIDLKIKNTGKIPLQIKIWITDKHLKGQLVSDQKSKEKYFLKEESHLFIKKNNKYFRYNEIWRIKKIEGKEIKKELIFSNFAPVLYEIDEKYCKKNHYKLIDVTQ